MSGKPGYGGFDRTGAAMARDERGSATPTTRPLHGDQQLDFRCEWAQESAAGFGAGSGMPGTECLGKRVAKRVVGE